MDNSAFRVNSGEIGGYVPTSSPPSKLKTFGFAIAIIVGIGGLGVGATGLAGYFHVGALSNMAQINAIIMMAAGCGGGTILLIIGGVGTVKNRQNISHELHGGVHVESDDRIAFSAERAEIIKSIDTQEGSLYGPEAWKIWDVEVLDAVPPTPQVDLSKKDKVLLYIPQRIRVHHKQQDFMLKDLEKISGGPFRYFREELKAQFGNSMAPGWVLIDKNVIDESRNQDYETQKQMVEARGCSMPSVLEALVLNLMVFAFTGERLYGLEEPRTYTRCIEKDHKGDSVIVGGFSPDSILRGPGGLFCSHNTINNNCFGVACALRKF